MADLDPGDHTVDELRDELEGIDDPGDLQEILESERDDEDRKGAKEAIERRLDSVGGDGETPDTDSDAGSDGVEGDAAADDDGDTEAGNGTADLLSVQQTVRSDAGDLIGHQLDGVTEISERDGGWRAVVDVVERPSVPDTQDILGRYEIDLDEGGSITGFRRLDRYRRGETSEVR